jgi:hypothetical protein
MRLLTGFQKNCLPCVLHQYCKSWHFSVFQFLTMAELSFPRLHHGYICDNNRTWCKQRQIQFGIEWYPWIVMLIPIIHTGTHKKLSPIVKKTVLRNCGAWFFLTMAKFFLLWRNTHVQFFVFIFSDYYHRHRIRCKIEFHTHLHYITKAENQIPLCTIQNTPPYKR